MVRSFIALRNSSFIHVLVFFLLAHHFQEEGVMLFVVAPTVMLSVIPQVMLTVVSFASSFLCGQFNPARLPFSFRVSQPTLSVHVHCGLLSLSLVSG